MPERAITLAKFRGRGGPDLSMDLPDDIAREALNIEWYNSSLGSKREGVAAVAHGAVFAGNRLSTLKTFVPGSSNNAIELWGVDNAATPNLGRMAAATTFAAITPADNIETRPQDTRMVGFNGKLFMAYNSTVDRLHCWDPNTSTGVQRRVGMVTPAAPTVANTGAGTYAATLRYYRVRYVEIRSSVVIRRSEPSASTSFTPSGTGTAARVTKPAASSPAEYETHWEIEASTDNVTFWRLSQTAVGTTTYDDSAVVATYPDNTASARVGAYEAPISFRYIAAFNNQLVGLGGWESGAFNSRIYYTPPLGTTGEGDDERIIDTTDQKNFEGINENDGGVGTGFGGPLMGNLLAFKDQQIWKLIPSSNASRPLIPFMTHSGAGAVRQEAIVNGFDEEGNECVYFLDRKLGPCRIGRRGFEWIGEDVEDLWLTFNQPAANVTCWGMRYPEKGQIRFWVARASSDDPDTILVFHERLGGWTTDPQGRRVFSGGWALWNTPATGLPRARCGVLFARTPGATMSLDQRPYYGDSGANDILWRSDNGQDDDAGVTFQGLLTTKDYVLADGRKVRTGDPMLVAEAASGVTITSTIIEDFGLNQSGGGTARSGTALLTATGSESFVIRKLEGHQSAGAAIHRYTLGDAAAASNGWNLARFIVPILEREEVFRGN